MCDHCTTTARCQCCLETCVWPTFMWPCFSCKDWALLALVEACIQFKLCLLVHRTLIGKALSYIMDLLQPVSTVLHLATGVGVSSTENMPEFRRACLSVAAPNCGTTKHCSFALLRILTDTFTVCSTVPMSHSNAHNVVVIMIWNIWYYWSVPLHTLKNDLSSATAQQRFTYWSPFSPLANKNQYWRNSVGCISSLVTKLSKVTSQGCKH